MEALLGHSSSDTTIDAKWGKMFLVSLVLHLVVFSSILFIPENIRTRDIRGPIYEVNLVEMPREKRQAPVKTITKSKPVKRLAPAKTSSAKKITKLTGKSKPLVVSKKVTKSKTRKLAPSEDSASKHIDQTIERIKKKVKDDEKSSRDQANAKPDVAAQGSPGEQRHGKAQNGITIHLYRMDIYNMIKSHWSYPVHDDESLVAIVLLTVKNNGTILKTSMTHSSGNERFDQSVLKAIKRSDPLPPFPEGYRKTHEEIEINFNLSELEN